jgi:Flp pilus assembly protein TadG
MLIRAKARRRSGASVVESAVVLPVVFLLLFAIVYGASLVFTYQEVANLSREGSRYASVHGYDYKFYTMRDAATPAEVFEKGIKPKMMTVDPARVQYSVTWNTNNRPGSTVTVEVRYRWTGWLIGNVDLVSRSTVTMAY